MLVVYVKILGVGVLLGVRVGKQYAQEGAGYIWKCSLCMLLGVGKQYAQEGAGYIYGNVPCVWVKNT